MSAKLDMSLDQLILSKKKKPATPGRKPVGKQQQAGGGGKAGGAKQGGGGRGQQQQQQQQQQVQKKQLQKPGVKPRAGQSAQQARAGLKVKGGITKGGQANGRAAVKILPRPGAQQQQQQQRRVADVRIVPRPGGTTGHVAIAGMMRGGSAMMMGRPAGYMAPGMAGGMAPYMMAPMMPMQAAVPMQQAAPAPQQQQLFDGSVVSSNTSSKLLISNLDHKVTDDDVRELFGTVGPIKDSGVHYDRNGRSAGSAFVVFEKRTHALEAFNRYNNVALDNKKMCIEVVEQAVPRGTFKTLSSGINVSRAQQAAAAAAGVRGRGAAEYVPE